MKNLEIKAYKANECSSFLHSAIQSLTNGRSDIDHKDAYFKREELEGADSQTPSPLLINVINLNRKAIRKVVQELPRIVQNESWRFNNILNHLKPFISFDLEDKGEVYLVTPSGLVTSRYEEVVSKDQIAISVPEWLRDYHARDIYSALSTANHKIFAKRFTPYFFDGNPRYGSFYRPEDANLVREHIGEIKNNEPIRAKELEEILK